MKKGLFIALEGGEGTGKDTQIDLLKQKFSDDNVVFTREPGGTVIGEQIRALLLNKNSTEMSVETELMLFLAARAQLVKEIIAPALCAGKMIITNRFGLSTVAYQIYGRERLDHEDFLAQLSDAVVQAATPDLYILIDLDPAIGQTRITTRAKENDRFDSEKLAFHQRVRQGYREAVKKTKNHIIIDGGRSIEEIQQEIVAAITQTQKTISVEATSVCAMVK